MVPSTKFLNPKESSTMNDEQFNALIKKLEKLASLNRSPKTEQNYPVNLERL